ncbi:fungal-specific transcription factor domain-containing protein [Kalaharituber pfeilii]|nr:fungal-specific transcription factor domain-containing protein [Kalaharituber pfeilii]
MLGDGSRKDPTTVNGKRAANAEDTNHTNSGPPKLYHTLTACTRCRSRKTRCDAGLPKCGPCERSGAHCEFFDSTKQKTIPRSYVVHLQAKVRELEAEIAKQEAAFSEVEQPDSRELVRGVGLVKFDDEKGEPRFVGTSSGITMTRLVIDFAKKHLEKDSVKEIKEHRNNFRQGQRISGSPGSQTRSPVALPGAAPQLPSREVTDRLVEIFCQKAQFVLPILHEPTFLGYVDDIYNKHDKDPVKLFQLKNVLAISMQKISPQYASLADSYYLASFEHLDEILEPMNMTTLQCLALMASYSLLTPTRTAVYHVVGIIVRLCIQLGFAQEKTITLSDVPIDPITMDLRRRLFWVVASFEYGLSHVLGRPSGFATMDGYVDVKFYEPVEDKYITKDGILPAPPSPKKLISMHFFRLRRLQAQIRQTLYQNPRPTPKDDTDPWFAEMYAKIEAWRQAAPVSDHGSGLTNDWFIHRYNNLIIFLYRPSPQIPEPSLEATLICYNSAAKNVYLQKKMFDQRSVDITFVFIYQISMTITTLIWCCCSEEIRRVHKKETIKAHLDTSLSVLSGLAHKWPGTEAAVDVYQKLAKAALSSYDEDAKRKQRSPPISTRSTPPAQFENGQTLSRSSTNQSQKTASPPPTRVSPSATANTSPSQRQHQLQQLPQMLHHSNPQTPSPTTSHTSISFSPSSGQTHHTHPASPELLLEPLALQDLQRIMWNQAQSQVYGIAGQDFDPFGFQSQMPSTSHSPHHPSLQMSSGLENIQFPTQQFNQEYYPSQQPQDMYRSQQERQLEQQQQEWRSQQEQQRELMMILEDEAQMRYNHNQQTGWGMYGDI